MRASRRREVGFTPTKCEAAGDAEQLGRQNVLLAFLLFCFVPEPLVLPITAVAWKLRGT